MSNRNPSANYQQGGQPPLPGQTAYAQTPEQAAAHAAAWAAYYQSQGMTAPQAHSAPTTPAQAPSAGAPAAQNPYANYGYGAGAQHNKPQPPAAGPSQQSYRPPASNQAFATASTQPSLGYPQQQAYPVQPQYPQAGYQPGRPPYQQPAPPAQQPYAWQAGQQPQIQPGQPAYRPPAQPQQPYTGYAAQPAGPYYPPAQPQPAPYTPPQPSVQSPYRPPMGGPNMSSPMQSQPTQFRPPALLGNQGRPPRPPMSNQPGGGGGGGFPPAKRPRFDGPGGGGNKMTQGRPPNNGPQGPPIGQRNVSRPNLPINRPPIHLGAGPPLASGPGGPSGVFAPPSGPGQPKAGPMRGNDSRRGRGGMMNAPRGPATMRRPDGSFAPSAFSKGVAPGAGKNVFDKRGNKKLGGAVQGKDTVKATMTDWRIVGIEMKGLGWAWGIVDGQKAEAESEVKVEGQEPVVNTNGEAQAKVELTEAEPAKPIESASALISAVESSEFAPVKSEPSLEPQTETSLASKAESEAAIAAAVAEESEKEKRGEKRKAKSPDTEDGDEHHSAKRSVPFKPTTPVTADLALPPSASAATTPQQVSQSTRESPVKTTEDSAKDLLAKYENNSNRLRIYFESPPELDRAPKVKKTPVKAKEGQEGRGNKRFRSVSVSASVIEEKEGDEALGEEELSVEAAVPAQEQNETEQGDDQAQEDVDHSLGLGENVLATSNVNDTANGSAAVATPDIHNTADLQASEEQPIAELLPEHFEYPAPLAEETHAKVEAKEEVGDGDVSMRTEKGDGLADSTAVESLQAEMVEGSLPGTSGVNGDSMTPGPVEKSAADAAESIESQNEGKSKTNDEVEQSADDKEHGIDEEDQAAKDAKDVSEAAVAAAALAESATNAASAYKSRARRHSSVSTSSHAPAERHPKSANAASPGVSWNRLSVVWEQSTRRLCFDAEVVEKVRIWRQEGKIEVELKEGEKEEKAQETTEERREKEPEGKTEEGSKYSIRGNKNDLKEDNKEGVKESAGEWQGLPKGIMMELYSPSEQRFLPYTSPSDDPSVPPLHLISSTLANTNSPVVVTVHLNTKNALSEPKWLKSNQADAWLFEQFESKKGVDAGWRGKLEVMDPDPAPTLPGILDGWASSCTLGTPSSRRAFTSFLSSSPDDLLEILLRLGRGDRNHTLGSSSSPSFGPLATLIRPDSPFANHQTHVSLAILAMYRLTTDMAEKAGEKKEAVEEKVGDIIRSLPGALVAKSLDGLFREWQG
ncbi:hypothetical protein B9479_002796 [Cryptococcus floricola]|uniref:Uncharacterized protein n=1 Tax=Cryptococcus floricola TaxID=2591691 RepID=A0A5D3B205_9TREE|nr:hypothetical protein B9479_002796 [Cryptococcus floricola]